MGSCWSLIFIEDAKRRDMFHMQRMRRSELFLAGHSRNLLVPGGLMMDERLKNSVLDVGY